MLKISPYGILIYLSEAPGSLLWTLLAPLDFILKAENNVVFEKI